MGVLLIIHKTYGRDQDYSIVIQYDHSIFSIRIEHTYTIWEVSNYNGPTIQYVWYKSSRRRYSNILQRN